MRVRSSGFKEYLPVLTSNALYQASTLHSGSDDAELRGRVGVRRQLIPQRVFARFRPPGLRVRQKEAVIAAKAVDHRRRLVLQRRMVRVERAQNADLCALRARSVFSAPLAQSASPASD